MKYTIDLDVDAIINDYILGNNEGYNIEGHVKNRVNNAVMKIITDEVSKKMSIENLAIDPNQLVDSYMNITNSKLKENIELTYSKALDKFLQDKERGVNRIIANYINEFFQKKYYKFIQELIGNTIVINQIDMENEREAMEKSWQSEVKSAFEAGQDRSVPF